VLLVAQGVALALLIPFALLIVDEVPEASAIGWAALAGSAGIVALGSLYRGLAIGTMSVVAPISATGAAVPVLVGLAQGERPDTPQVVGMGLALIGVILASREPAEDGPSPKRAAIGLALVAALGFGAFYVAMDKATAQAGVAGALIVARAASLTLLVLAALVVRPELPREVANIAKLGVIGLLDLSANGLYALATREGLLSVVSVLGSLYPAVTVVLARVVLRERVARAQEAGVLLALAGVVAITAG
jgi:drug/metabolite transporter (DMT)-like permease